MPAHPRLAALTTAVPRHKLCRDDVIEMARLVWGAKGVELGRVMPIYDNAGIDSRYSCVPIEWYAKDHGWTERNALYVENAVTLLEQAARDVLDRAGLGVADIDAVVAVSTTGIATPSLDALLIERMGLRRDVTRLPVFGLGCAGRASGRAPHHLRLERTERRLRSIPAVLAARRPGGQRRASGLRRSGTLAVR